MSCYEIFIKGSDSSKWINDVASIASIGTYSAQIISGIILIWSVYKVRAFMLERKIESQGLNVRSMWLHASAFGIFTVSIAAFTVVYANYLFHFDQDSTGTVCNIAFIVMFILSFVSQCLLCAIFWQLGTVETSRKSDSDKSSASSEASDQDAELQERIWYSFISDIKELQEQNNLNYSGKNCAD